MPKKRQFVTRVPNGGGLHLSNAGIALIGSLLALLAIMYKVAVSVALKDDVAAVQNTCKAEVAVVQGKVDTIDNRERNTEILLARFFGKDQGGTQPSTEPLPAEYSSPLELKVQYPLPAPSSSANSSSIQQTIRAPRRFVVKEWFVKQFDLQPAKGGSYTLLGEDGQAYALDDVIAALIDIHEQNKAKWERLRMKK